MKKEKLKELIIESLSGDEPDRDLLRQLEETGVSYSFSNDFTQKVINRIYSAEQSGNKNNDFTRLFYKTFYRIAITGIAAIILLLVSIYLSQGSLTIDSFFGLGDGFEESILCVLTGN